MARPGYRAQLESGLKLDLSSLAKRGFVRPGAYTGPVGIGWTSNYWGEIASGIITADMSGTDEGWFNIKIGELNQRIILVARPRHFGGRQWFFMCPYLNRRATCFGCRRARVHSLVGRNGVGRSPMRRNSWTVTAERTGRSQRSTPGSVQSLALIPRIGISRQSQNGCGGKPTSKPRRNSIGMRRS
jgi:hypothetical protein